MLTKAQLHAEWLKFFADAIRYGADKIKASRIATVLVYGREEQ